jgi:hypothetical protein
MAQSALTVTPPNPTPPTNMSFTGATPPNPPNYTKTTYADWLDNTKFDSAPPPYFDDGAAGSPIVFAANTAALASGTGATAGGTEGSYPGATNGVVPASSSVPHEAAGTETLATWGVQWPTGGAGVYNPNGPLTMVGVGPALTAASIAAGPNASHASSLSPATNPTLASITPTTAASGASGTTALTAVTGTGFTRQSVVYANGVPVPTVYSSPTTLTATMPKKTSAGPWPITVVTGGVVTTAPQTFTWT